MNRPLGSLAAVCLLFALAAPAAATEPAPFAVTVHGEGPPVLLIPGLATSGSVWDGTVARLRDDYEVHVLTLAGFAGQPPIGEPFLPAVRDALLAYIDRRGLERPALVGHSLGGFLAFWVAATDPGCCRAIVAVDGVPFLPALLDPSASEESVRPRAEQARQMFATLSAEQFALQNRMSLAAMTRSPDDVHRLAEAGGRSHPPSVGQAILEVMTTDLRDEVAAIAAPVLLIGAGETPGGAAPEAVAAAYRAQIAAIPDATFVQVPGARHFVMLDAAGPFHRLLEELLAGAGPSAAVPTEGD
jgi:N-formylmaleamate deformylase